MLSRETRQTQTFRGWICLLSYLLVWIGSAQVFPLLFLAAGHSHKIFLGESHNQIHLILHHPGVQDQHEAPETSPSGHRHDLVDPALAATSTGSPSEKNHVIHVPKQKEQAVATTGIINLSKDASPLIVIQTWPMIVKPVSVRSFSGSPPKFDPILVALRTIALLI